MSAREAILTRVRAATAGTRAPPAAEMIPRAAGTLTEDPLARFRRLAEASGSTLDEAASAAVPGCVAAYLKDAGLTHAAVVWPALAALPWAAAGIAAEARAPQTTDAIGITAACCGIAETGTLLLLSAGDSPGATSLVPETHIALLPRERIVRDFEAAFARVHAERGALPRALAFISGPSRTADIEQTIVIGAHGPKRVHIILVG